MKFLTVGRGIHAGFIHFWRNIWLSLAATGVMMLALSMLALVLVVTVLGQRILGTIEDKVDITVFMADSATESAILAVKSDLEGREDVETVVYVSKDSALASFRERHKENPLIAHALEELGSNPLQAALVIRATQTEAYAQIAEALRSPKYESYIARVTYDDNREVITRLTAFIGTMRRIGLGMTITLAVIAILVTFNTVRLAIYGSHEEIEIMHLVGASPWFIKGPFLIEGMLAGGIAATFTLGLLYPLLRILSPRLGAFFVEGRFDLYTWAVQNAWIVIGMVAGTGIVLGIVSSLIAVQRYLHED
jgi:cell division transport system permease protein